MTYIINIELELDYYMDILIIFLFLEIFKSELVIVIKLYKIELIYI